MQDDGRNRRHGYKNWHTGGLDFSNKLTLRKEMEKLHKCMQYQFESVAITA